MNNRIDQIIAETDVMNADNGTAKQRKKPEKRKVCFSGRTYSELQNASDIAAFDYAVKGMFAMGEVTMVVADAKLGKTWLGFQLAVCASKGLPFLKRNVRQMRVVYLDLEMGAFDEKQRSRAIARKLGVPTENLDIAFIAGDEQETAPTLYNLEAGLEGFLEETNWDFKDLLLIIDTFGEIASDIEENTASETRAAISGLRKLARTRNCAVVVFHHTTKDGDTYRGSSAIRGAVDNLLFMRWASKKEKKAAIVEKGKSFVVLYDDARRRRCPFEPLHLTRVTINREGGEGLSYNGGAGPLDDSKLDGFIWETLGAVGKEDPDADSGETLPWQDDDGDDGAQSSPADVIGGDLGAVGEQSRKKRASDVVSTFRSCDEQVKRAELEQRYAETKNLGRESGKKAVTETIDLGLIEKSGVSQRAPYSLTTDGVREWDRLHPIRSDEEDGVISLADLLNSSAEGDLKIHGDESTT